MKKLFITTLCMLFILTACGQSTEEVEWGYGAENGPDKWAELDSEYETCGAGTEQSPINIETDAATAGENTLEINYSSDFFTEFDNGHTIEYEEHGTENTVVYNGVTYTLSQFHIHTPSENEINGESYPAELHFVNKDADGNTLVLSVMVEIGAENPAIGDTFAAPSTDEENEEEFTLNPEQLIPTYESFYTFDGSLTTPPCTEGVQWVVLDTPISISQQQFDDLEKHYSGNNRPTQELNDRVVTAN